MTIWLIFIIITISFLSKYTVSAQYMLWFNWIEGSNYAAFLDKEEIHLTESKIPLEE